MNPTDVLRASNFGKRVAEEETNDLSAYFVQTEQWRKVFNGEVDTIYGPKGSGKSAIYLLMTEHQVDFYGRGVILVPAEEPRGQPAFRTVETDPPTSEPEFQGLWKLYFATLIQASLRDYQIDNEPARNLRRILDEAHLIAASGGLAQILQNVRAYVRHVFRPPAAVEAGVQLNQLSGAVEGVSGKIVFAEPPINRPDLTSVDRLLKYGNDALAVSRSTIWLVLDRLDVAFADNTDLEKNALRALFRVYLDMRSLPNVVPKIFLRTDIWKRITEEGFREASHITNSVTIRWEPRTLLNLVVNRLLKNSAICEYYGVDPAAVRASAAKQEAFFYRVFPQQIDAGPNKPKSIMWMITRTQDGTRQPAPREIIHLLNAARDNQLQRLELGTDEDESGTLISRQAIREALPEVSRTRLQQTVYAEYPRLKPLIERLQGQHTLQHVDTLASIWGTTTEETRRHANDLVEIGFFEPRGTNDDPLFWVPFVYRDAAQMIQGTASADE